MSTAGTHAELSIRLRDAMTGDAKAFVDALYDVEAIEDEQLREIVIEARDTTKAMFEGVRTRLAGAGVEIVGEVREGDRYITVVEVEDGPRLQIVVDDVYERGGILHTRDLIRILDSKI